MSFYLVGTPESVNINLSIVYKWEKKFTKKEIGLNLKNTENIRLFDSLDDAREYARSLRVCRGALVIDVSKRKFAPVVHVDLLVDSSKYHFNENNQQTETVLVKKYRNYNSNSHEHSYNATVRFMPTADIDFNLNDFQINACEFPDTDYPITHFNLIKLPFFRALNPVAKNSGITYCFAGERPCQGTEMLDYTVSESIRKAFDNDLNFLSGLAATFNVIVGEHYDLYLKGQFNSHGGTKGVLDYLIFPLLARKLIADTCFAEKRESPFINELAWLIAIPLELARFSAGIVLTLLLAPVVALIHLIKTCLPKNDIENSNLPLGMNLE